MRACVGLIALSACTAYEPLALPSDLSGSAVISISRSEARHEAWISTTAAELPPLIGRGGERLYLLELAHALDVLALTPGPLPEPSAPDTGRTLPAPARVLEYTAGVWEERDAPDDLDWIASIRVPNLSPAECVRRDGCYTLEDDGCRIPCAEATLAAPELPAEPSPPVFEPCPAGWSLAAPPGLPDELHCAPPPLVACSSPDAQILGETSCAPLGSSCAADGFVPEPIAGTNVIFVDPSAPSGGDGRRVSPFDTLALALALAAPGDTIALAGTRYLVTAAFPAGVGFAGCGASTLAGAIRFDGETSLSDLRLEPSGRILLDAGQALSVTRVSILGALELRGDARIDGERLVLTSSRSTALYLRDSGVTATLLGARITAHRARAVVQEGGMLALTDAGIETNGPWSVDHEGVRTIAGHVSLTRVLVQNAMPIGVRVEGAGTTATLQDLRVTDTRAPHRGSILSEGTGLLITDGAHADLRRVVAYRNAQLGIFVREASELIGEDILILRTPSKVGKSPSALQVVSSTVTMRRVRVVESRVFGVFITASTGTIDDLFVRDTLGYGADLGDGLLIGRSHLRFRRVVLERSEALGLSLASYNHEDVPNVVDLEDLRITDTRCGPIRGGCTAILVQHSSTLSARRVHVTGPESGVARIEDLARATIEDLTADGTPNRASLTDEAYGIELREGGSTKVGSDPQLALDRAVLLRRRSYGVSVETGRIVAQDIRIEDLVQNEMNPTFCMILTLIDQPVKPAEQQAAGAIELTRFRCARGIRGASLRTGTLALHDGELRDLAIGIELFDAPRSAVMVDDDVRIRNVESRLHLR